MELNRPGRAYVHEAFPSASEKLKSLSHEVQCGRQKSLARLQRVLSVEDAEDAYQDACLRALRRLDRQQGEASLRAWFNVILRNVVASRVRSNSRGEAGDARMPGLSQARNDEQAALCRCGLQALRRLRPSYQRVIQGVLVGGRSISEVAAIDRTSSNNTRVRLHRARNALRDAWVEICGPCITDEAGGSCACSEHCDARFQ